MIDAMKKRRSVYALGRDLPVAEDELLKMIEQACELTPDAFNMKSQRLVVALGDKQNELWNKIYEAFGGKVAREKIDGFKNAYGTVLYFTDQSVVEQFKEQFEAYAPNFAPWANQAIGMLQINIWNMLADQGIGANIQHYNPVIDDAVKELFDIPDNWVLNAQMPFGSINENPPTKEGEDISQRVKIFR